MSRRIFDISEDVCGQLSDSVKGKDFAIQIDEATDTHSDAHLFGYIKFIDKTMLQKELFFVNHFQLMQI